MFESKKNLVLIFIAALISGSLLAQEEDLNTKLAENGCASVEDTSPKLCIGTYRARNLQDLEGYRNDFGSRWGVVGKNLVIDFDIEVDSLDLYSPCNITFTRRSSVKTTTGSLCIISRRNITSNKTDFVSNSNAVFESLTSSIVLRRSSTIKGNNVSIKGDERVFLNRGGSIEATGDLTLISEHPRGLVKFGIDTNVSAKNLNITTDDARIRRDSTVTVSENFTMNGDGSSSLLRIDRNTTVTAQTVDVNGVNTTRMQNGVVVTTNSIDLDSATCDFNSSATINSSYVNGSCFDSATLIASLSRSPNGIVSTGSSVSFNASNSQGLIAVAQYNWTIGSYTYSTLTPIFNYSFYSAGSYQVSLEIIAHDGRSSTDSLTVDVQGPPPAEIPPVARVEVTNDKMTNPYFVTVDGTNSSDDDSDIVSYAVDFGDGNSTTSTNSLFTHSYATGGLYLVTLTVKDSQNLESSATSTVFINNPPVANLALSETILNIPATIGIDARGSTDLGGSIVEYTFSLNGVTETNTTGVLYKEYTEAGIVDVFVTVKDNEGATTQSDTQTFRLNGAPFARFTPDPYTGYAPLTVTLSAEESSDDPHSTLNYEWDIASITSASGESTTYTFNDPGEYPITLTVTDDQGLTSTSSMNLTVRRVNEAPIASFTHSADRGNPPVEISFNAVSSSDDGEIVSYIWDWGDGTTTNARLPESTHTFKTPGDFNVVLKVKDNDGVESAIFQKTLSVNNPPAANFTLSQTSGNPGLVVSLNPSTTTDDIEVTSIEIDFGEGAPITQTNLNPVSYTYLNSGNFTVSVKATDNEGATHSSSQTVSVNYPPSSNLTLTNATGDFPLVVSANANASDDKGIVEYNYNFGDGNSLVSTDPSSTHTYQTPGTYSFSVTVKDTEGLTQTSSSQVVVNENPLPLADFSIDPIGKIAPFEINFNGGGSTDNREISSYSYEIEGITKTGSSVSHLFSAPGTYPVTLTVVDDQGGVSSISKDVVMLANTDPVADFNFSGNGSEYPVGLTFDSNSLDDEGITSFQWKIDNVVQSSASEVLTHVFESAGIYDVTLTVTDRHGATDSISKLVNIVDQGVLPELNAPSVTFEDMDSAILSTTSSIYFDLSDDSGVDYSRLRVRLNGQSVDSTYLVIDELINRVTIDFSGSLDLLNNQYNSLIVLASDIYGNVGSGAVGFEVRDSFEGDTEGPDFNFDPGDGNIESTEMILTISYYDQNDIVSNSLSLTLNGNAIPEAQYTHDELLDTISLNFDSSYPLDENILNIVQISLTDSLGNTGTASIGLDVTNDLAISTGLPLEGYTVGTQANCAVLEDHTVRCFGYGRDTGALGYGNQIQRVGWDSGFLISDMGPVPVGFPVKEIRQKGHTVCALSTTGEAKCWGNNLRGQLGLGHTVNIGYNQPASSIPSLPFGEEVLKIVPGGDHTCALFNGGKVKCWGRNIYGELGYGHTDSIGDDETIENLDYVDVGGYVIDIDVSQHLTCALLDTRDLKCWGSNDRAKLGSYESGLNNPLTNVGDDELPSSFPPINFGGKKVKDFTADGNTSCAILEDESLKCWGGNLHGTAGLGYTSVTVPNHVQVHPVNVPDVPLSGTPLKVRSGQGSVCVIFDNGDLKCWGLNYYSRLGYPGLDFYDKLGDDEPLSSFGNVNVGSPIADVDLGFYNICARLVSGGMKCWGYNQVGSFGYPSPLDNRTIGDDEHPAVNPVIDFGGLDLLVEEGNSLLAKFDATPSFGPSPLTVSLDASESESLESSIVEYKWIFDDGTPDQFGVTTSHTFSTLGPKEITLRVKDSEGNEAETSRVVNVFEGFAPIAQLSVNLLSGSVPLSLTLNASESFDLDGTIDTFEYFVNGSTIGEFSSITNLTLTNSGSHEITVKVTDNHGNISISDPVTVYAAPLNESPLADFSCDVVNQSLNCNATESLDYDGSISTYEWSMGDGTTLFGESISHNYLVPNNGVYSVNLKIYDNDVSIGEIQKVFNLDSSLPQISLSNNDSLTNDSSYSFDIAVADTSYTNYLVYLNGSSVPSDSGSEINASSNLSLSPGSNSIRVIVNDSVGNSSETSFNVFYDDSNPTLNLSNPLANFEITSFNYVFSGTSNEELSSLRLNGSEVPLLADNRSFNSLISATNEGDISLTIELTDLAGNITTITESRFVDVPVFNHGLITTMPGSEAGKVKIVGAQGASRLANHTFVAKSGFFNSVESTTNSDGSFEVELDYFQGAELRAFNPAINRDSFLQVEYNADTTLSGVVKDTDDNPIVGALITIKSSNQQALTDGNGQFVILNPSTGDQEIIVDGSTATLSLNQQDREFSSITVLENIGSLQLNTLSRTIYLAPLMKDGTETVIDSNAGATVSVTSPHAPGVELVIPTDVISFPGNNSSGAINISIVNKDKTSVPVPSFAEPDTVIALEPSGLTFSEPVELTLPNVNEFPEGMQLLIMSKNSKTGTWEVDGLARVDAGGSTLTTEEDAGITHFSEVFAAPIGLNVTQIGSKDKPGADTFNGAVSTTVNLPSYKSFGSDITPSLIYNSNWAKPTAVVTNLFDVPRKQMSIQQALYEGGRSLRADQVGDGYVYVTPDYIDVQFFSENITSEKMRFTGLPNKSVVSYAMDLSGFESGVSPYISTYEMHLKQMVMRPQKASIEKIIQYGGAQNVPKYRVESEIEITKAFNSDLSGPVFVQNKTQSSAGKGWKISGEQRIYDKNSPRVMIEEADGSIASYTINNTIDTIFENSEDIQGVDFSNPNLIKLTDKRSKISSLDLSVSEPEAIEEARLDRFIGSFGSIYSVCGAGGDRSVCSQYENCFRETFNFQLNRDVRSLIDIGGSYYALDNQGLIYKTTDNAVQMLAGKTKTPQRFFQISDFPVPGRESTLAWNHCDGNDLLECSSPTNKDAVLQYVGIFGSEPTVASFSAFPLGVLPAGYGFMNRGFCALWAPGFPHDGNFPFRESTGSYPDAGYSEGEAGESKLNNPMHMIFGFSNNLLIADSGNNRVRSLDLSTNTLSTIAGNGQNFDNGDGGDATSASLYHPRALARDNSGNIFVVTENGKIRQINSEGKISTYGGRNYLDSSPEATLDDVSHISFTKLKDPQGIIIDTDNDLMYIADTGHHRILSVNMATKIATVIAGGGVSCAQSLVGDGSAAVDASLCSPTTLGLDADKNLLVLDKGHKRIRRITFSSSENGTLSYLPASQDNSILKKLSDNTFERTYRDGTKAHFDESGKQISLEARNGRVVEYSYDIEGNLVSQKDPSGSEILYNYSGGKLDTIIDPAGRETQFTYDGDNLDTVTLPDGTTRVFEYDLNGRLVREYDQRSNPTEYAYNNYGRLIEVTRADGSSVKIDDSTSKSIGNSYTNGEEGAFATYGTAESELYDGIKDGKNQETKFVKDVNGYVSTIVDALGRETKVERNLKGLPTKITRPDSTEALFTYDEDTNDLLKKIDSATGVELDYTYNEYGQPLSRELPGDRFETRTYDGSSGDLLTITNPLGQTDTIEYYPLSLVRKRTNHEGQFSEFFYDSFGNLITSKDSLGFETNFTRDPAGNVVKVTNSKGQETFNTYDSFNRLISVRTPKGELTSYEYLATGELSKITDPEGNITLFEYDVLGRLVKKTDPLLNETVLVYDDNGNVISETDPNGNIKTYVYDSVDQLIERHLPDNDYFIEYDVRGNVTQVKNLHSQIDYEYVRLETGDTVSKVTSSGLGNHADLPSFVVDYDYDVRGNRTDMFTALGDFQYTYDSGDRLRELENHKGEVFNFNYDDANRLREIIRPGSRTVLNFDDSNFLEQIVHSKVSNGSLIEEYNYGRDAIGNRVSITTTRGIASYGYDDNNQLTSSNMPDVGAESFVYDSLGNRVNDSNGNYVYDTYKQRLTEDYKYFYFYDGNGNLSSKNSKTSTEVIQYVHNSENQLVGIDYFDGTTKTKEVTYVYDAIGRRVKKIVVDNQDGTKSFERRFVYDANEVLAQMDETNQVLSTYTHSTLRTDDALSVDISAQGVVKGLAQNAQSYFYSKDAQGTIIDILDSAGSKVQHYVYSAFGELKKVLDSSNADITALVVLQPFFSYTNREYDSESGMYYYRARYYDSSIGRFIQEDPDVGIVMSPDTFLSKFIYVGNCPTEYIDPMGKFNIRREVKNLGDWVNKNVSKDLQRTLAYTGGMVLVIAGGPVLVGAGIGLMYGSLTAGKGESPLVKALQFGTIGAASAFMVSSVVGASAAHFTAAQNVALSAVVGGGTGFFVGKAVGANPIEAAVVGATIGMVTTTIPGSTGGAGSNSTIINSSKGSAGSSAQPPKGPRETSRRNWHTKHIGENR